MFYFWLILPKFRPSLTISRRYGSTNVEFCQAVGRNLYLGRPCRSTINFSKFHTRSFTRTGVQKILWVSVITSLVGGQASWNSHRCQIGFGKKDEKWTENLANGWPSRDPRVRFGISVPVLSFSCFGGSSLNKSWNMGASRPIQFSVLQFRIHDTVRQDPNFGYTRSTQWKFTQFGA